MPRVAMVSVDEAVQILIKFVDHFKDAHFPPFSSPVWKLMSNACDNKWSPALVYTNIVQNRRQIVTIMRDKLGIVLDTNYNTPDISLNDPKLDLTIRPSVSDENDPDYKTSPTFVLILDNEIWQYVGPVLQQYERSYQILEPHVWTDLLFDEFFKQFRLPCAFIFKRAKIYPDPPKLNTT